jgi:hypothetical protein
MFEVFYRNMMPATIILCIYHLLFIIYYVLFSVYNGSMRETSCSSMMPAITIYYLSFIYHLFIIQYL